MNYFTLFGLPANYNIDIKALATSFQNKQRHYHPDKYVNRTQEEQLAAVQQSAIINQAWQTLRNPISRAEYFLSLHGLEFVSEQYTLRDRSFLIEQLKLSEELDNIKQTKNYELICSFIKRINTIFITYHASMVEQLNNKAWNVAADTLRKLRFIDKLKNSAELLAEQMLDF